MSGSKGSARRGTARHSLACPVTADMARLVAASHAPARQGAAAVARKGQPGPGSAALGATWCGLARQHGHGTTVLAPAALGWASHGSTGWPRLRQSRRPSAGQLTADTERLDRTTRDRARRGLARHLPAGTGKPRHDLARPGLTTHGRHGWSRLDQPRQRLSRHGSNGRARLDRGLPRHGVAGQHESRPTWHVVSRRRSARPGSHRHLSPAMQRGRA